MKVYFTELAEADLDSIAAHTSLEFGVEQCDLYLSILEDACERTILRFPGAGRPVPRRPELRSWRCESHVIYFRRVKGGIEIVRILHQRMLPHRHL